MKTDVYLYLQETAHGRRFWEILDDDSVGKKIYPDRTLRVIGPATVGAGGFRTTLNAAEALADLADIDLLDPASWASEDID